MYEDDYGMDEPMLLYCTDENGDDVCFELLAQGTYDGDGNEYALLGIKDDRLGGALAPVSTLIVRLSEDGGDTVMDPVDDPDLEDALYGIFEDALDSMYDFSDPEE